MSRLQTAASCGRGLIKLFSNALRRSGLILFGVCLLMSFVGAGCADQTGGPVVYYCDGAGWYSSAASVKAGLLSAGYRGKFETFSWSAFLGPGPDHLIAARNKSVARRLSKRIEQARRKDLDSPIYVMGLSAGTAVVLSALEQLSLGVRVDHVVLLSPSVSADHDLTHAMAHVKGRLYATSSTHDGILSTIVVNADGLPGPPAGIKGFRLPGKVRRNPRAPYRRVVNLPWRPAYVAHDWHGGHTQVTNQNFIKTVIAPRIFGAGAHPLDRSILDRVAAIIPGDEL